MLAYLVWCVNNMVYSPFETHKPCIVGQVLFLLCSCGIKNPKEK